jgi:hypothetical protein
VLVALLWCLAPSAADARERPAHAARAAEPAASLQPAATDAEWRRLVRHSPVRTFGATQGCRPLRAVFYAASDWMRLSTRLAAAASPCAQYFISVPPLAADKTRPRAGQASRIRALGPAFHALAEIHFVSWQAWVTSTGSSWYAAGVEARRRMAAQGYDVAAGDTWALNELSSAVRRGDGTVRADVREFVRGLYEAGGELPVAKGVVFVVGVGQGTPDLSIYKARTQEWLQDTSFWTDMNAWVSDWSQEVYPDVRAYAAPGVALADRRDALVDYLQHQTLLATAGGAIDGAALAFTTAVGAPLASAAWQWDANFGWTSVPSDLMQRFVSTQVYALRNYGATAGSATDHWGFAWAPRNGSGLAAAEFARQSGEVLDRLALAIRDSGNETPTDPGAGACGPPGQNLWCNGDLPGAALNGRWRGFRTWSLPALAFASPPQTVVAGAVSAPIGLQLQVAGAVSKPLAASTVTLGSTSPTGGFATTAAGPFTPNLTVTFPANAFATAQVFFQDTSAGAVTVSATSPGATPATQQLTVSGAALTSLSVQPAAASVMLGRTTVFTAQGVDVFGNLVPVSAVWSLAPGTPGSVVPASGPTTTYTASGRVGTGAVVATVSTATGPLSASTPVTVTPPPAARVSAVRYGVAKRRLHVYVTVVDPRGRRLRNASVTVAVYRNGKVYARAAGTTTAGSMTFSRPASWGAYRTRVTRVVVDGYAWNRKTPKNAFTKKLPRPGRR